MGAKERTDEKVLVLNGPNIIAGQTLKFMGTKAYLDIEQNCLNVGADLGFCNLQAVQYEAN